MQVRDSLAIAHQTCLSIVANRDEDDAVDLEEEELAPQYSSSSREEYATSIHEGH